MSDFDRFLRELSAEERAALAESLGRGESGGRRPAAEEPSGRR